MSVKNSIFPPSGPLEVVFSFDTTGSMYRWLEEIRGRIQDMIQRLQADIPGIRIAVLAHGDYDDEDTTYVTKWIDFTANVVKLCEFVNKVEKTQGGDAPECYELVLRQVRTELSWSPGSRRVLILIGDDIPHEPDEECNKDKINWRDETRDLALMGVTIYGVQCEGSNADAFYKTISVGTGGKHLRLDDFGSLFHTLMAVCYRESNDTAMLNNYMKEVRGGCGTKGMALDIDAIFASLRDETSSIYNTPMLRVDVNAKYRSINRKTTEVTSTAKAKLPPLPDPKHLLLPMPYMANPLLSMHHIANPLLPMPLITNPLLPMPHSKRPLLPMPHSKHPVLNMTRIKRAKAESKNKKRPKSIFPKAILNKYKLQNLPLLKRENVPEVNFKFRFLDWSKWILCLASSKDFSKGKRSLWQSRGDKPGQRLKRLPLTTCTTRRPTCTLVEVSVQTNGLRSKKHVVFSQRFKRCLKNVNWEEDLLQGVSKHVDMVLQAGCNIYIRYCFLGHREKISVVKDIKRYDYAWRCPWIKRTGARTVAKSGVIISQEFL